MSPLSCSPLLDLGRHFAALLSMAISSMPPSGTRVLKLLFPGQQTEVDQLQSRLSWILRATTRLRGSVGAPRPSPTYSNNCCLHGTLHPLSRIAQRTSPNDITLDSYAQVTASSTTASTMSCYSTTTDRPVHPAGSPTWDWDVACRSKIRQAMHQLHHLLTSHYPPTSADAQVSHPAEPPLLVLCTI